jgi:hypothetical protein
MYELEPAHASAPGLSVDETSMGAPRLAGYYELARTFCGTNGGPDDTRLRSTSVSATSDSSSILTGTTASLGPSTPSTSPPMTPLHYSELPIEDIYAGWAVDWEAGQNWRWYSALHDKKRRYVSDVVRDPPKQNVVVKFAVGVSRKLSTLFAH